MGNIMDKFNAPFEDYEVMSILHEDMTMDDFNTAMEEILEEQKQKRKEEIIRELDKDNKRLQLKAEILEYLNKVLDKLEEL